MNKAFKIIGIIALGLVCLAVVGLMIIGTIAPETYIYEGKEIPSKFVEKAKEFGIVAEGETIEYLYSDAMFKLQEGVFVFTKSNIGLHSTYWDFGKVIVPYDSILSIHAEYDDSFFGDSMITIVAGEDIEYYFPLSSEKGRDKKVITMIERRSGVKATVSKYEELEAAD